MRSPRWIHAARWTSLVLLTSTGCGAGGAGVVVGPSEAKSPAPAAVEAAPRPAPPAPATDAEPPPPAAEGDDPQTIAIPVAGTEFVRGRTTLKVNAPIEKVRESVLDFGHYAEFMPHYRSSKVLGRTAAGARDVYMEIEALYGAVKMWVEIEFPRPTIVEGVETHESKFVKGNVKDFKAIWRLRKLDDATTELSLEVFLQPSIPLPTALMNKENLGGSAKGVTAMRGRIEGVAASK
jgi:ribosome-associated toxin RatA of RatAB toxin-antitoxin module